MTANNAQLIHGLAVLLRDGSPRTMPYCKVLEGSVILRRHPFHLPTDMNMDRVHQEMTEDADMIHLIAYPGYTDPSVQNMATIVGHLSSDEVGNAYRYVRRITYGTHERGVVYFELGTIQGIFFCGGCTTDTGRGSHGKEQLDALFTLISTIYKIPFETYLVPRVRGIDHEKLIDDEWSRHRAQKSA